MLKNKFYCIIVIYLLFFISIFNLPKISAKELTDAADQKIDCNIKDMPNLKILETAKDNANKDMKEVEIPKDSETEKFCTKRASISKGSLTLNVYFFRENGVDKFKAWFDGQEKKVGIATKDEIAIVGDGSYKVKLESVDNELSATTNYFSKTCSQIYMNTYEEDGVIVVTGSLFSEADPDENYVGAINGEFTPEALCGEDGSKCNLEITRFCNEPYVARTLKLLGLTLFIAKILVPAIIIGMGLLDLIKIVTSGNAGNAKKQALNIAKRIAIGVIVFILPTILITVFNVAHSIAHDGEIPENVSNTELTMDVADFKNCAVCILEPENCVVRK